jgi:Kef-type K+ transport system membrane component KefB
VRCGSTSRSSQRPVCGFSRSAEASGRLDRLGVVISVDTGSFFAIVATAAVAALTVAIVPKRYAPPVVVVELIFGILIGPHVLGLAHSDKFIDFFSNLGLGMLFFFAGYEIDFERIRGTPLTLGLLGWLLSLALAYSIAGVLAAAGVVLSFLYTGSALATTAIGTLIPVLRDNGELRTRFGTDLLAAGAMGEFGPILLITLILSTTHPLHEAVILIAFIVLALALGLVSVRLTWRGFSVLERTLETSSQLAVRLAVLLVFGLLALAGQLGLDILLGGFVAGMITRAALRGHQLAAFESKLTAVGFGFLIPFFFITSGVTFDLPALATSAALLKLALFLVLFLVVRGTPAMLLYRHELGRRDRIALAVFCATELPLVVAITTLAVEGGHMRTSTSAGLVGAAILSTLIFPFVGLALRQGRGGRQGNVEPRPAPAGA